MDSHQSFSEIELINSLCMTQKRGFFYILAFGVLLQFEDYIIYKLN